MQRCSECGFLAIMRIGPEGWISANYDYRQAVESGRLGSYACPVKCFGLQTEFPIDSDDSVVREIIRNRPECPRFVQWEPSLKTPKEHLEMYLQNIAVELQRQVADTHVRIADLQTRQADAQTRMADLYAEVFRWKNEQSAKDEQLAMRFKALEQTWHNENKQSVFTSAMIAAAGGIIGGAVSGLIAWWLAQ